VAELASRFPQQAIVSMMAGISIETLQQLVAPAQSIARAIPLPAVAAREGATPIFPPIEAAKTLWRKAWRRRRPGVRSLPRLQDWRHSSTMTRRTSPSLLATMRHAAGSTNSSSACSNRHASLTQSVLAWTACSTG
jgi:hypothetical protein